MYRQRGVALITVMVLMAIMTLLGIALLNQVCIEIKSAASIRRAINTSLNAESGAFATAGWMSANKQANPPIEILKRNDFYEAECYYLPGLDKAIYHPPGYSTNWEGMVVKTTSGSPDLEHPISLIEGIVFIPTAPAGYGNE